jgi:hypothetical protein
MEMSTTVTIEQLISNTGWLQLLAMRLVRDQAAIDESGARHAAGRRRARAERWPAAEAVAGARDHQPGARAQREPAGRA